MTRHRAIITGAITALALALTPAAAEAGSLLSGYGGPGQGSQAILGAALLNAPGGGGGGASSSGTGEGGSTPSGTSSSGGQGPGKAGGGASHGGASAKETKGSGRSATTPAPGGSASQPQVVRASDDTHVLGLSGADLLYVLAALVALALTAAATRRLSGPARRERAG